MSTLAPDTRSIAYPQRGVRHIMVHVMLALLPGTLLQAWLINHRVLLILPVAILAALAFEALALRLRNKALRPALSDGSIILAAWLLALCVPPTLPLWQLLVGIFVLVMLGKHLYGGLGQNPFNPAMVAYAVLIISFPVTMTDWQTLQPESNDTPQSLAWDGLSGATPLDQLRQLRLQQASPGLVVVADTASDPAPSIDRTDMDASADASAAASTAASAAQSSTARATAAKSLPDALPGYPETAQDLIMNSSWKLINLAWLAGGLYLLLMRIISWHIPLAVLSSVTLMYIGLAASSTGHALPLTPALLSGAIMLGAFFIATDPVTAAASRSGKLVYGVGVGILTVLIREFSSYPEGLAFAVLLMNTGVPLIDFLLTGPAGRSRSDAS